MIRFEWDEQKRLSNIEKHGVDFQQATSFDFETAVEYLYIKNKEQRATAYGLISKRLYALVYTERDGNIRVISLRKANSREVKIYVEG
ncbi:MAG: uncharacterized DUF497 family protein [Phenylobacterium sp.]|jgi:uncharacterized DUF497 family protein